MPTSSRVEKVNSLCAGLQSTAEKEDDGPAHEGEPSPDPVCQRTGKTSAEERAACEQRYDGALLRSIRSELSVEVLGVDGSGDDAEIVAIEDGAERGEEGDAELVPLRGQHSGGDGGGDSCTGSQKQRAEEAILIIFPPPRTPGYAKGLHVDSRGENWSHEMMLVI